MNNVLFNNMFVDSFLDLISAFRAHGTRNNPAGFYSECRSIKPPQGVTAPSDSTNHDAVEFCYVKIVVSDVAKNDV